MGWRINEEIIDKKRIVFGRIVIFVTALFLVLLVITGALSYQTESVVKEYIKYDSPSGYSVKDILDPELTQNERERTGDIANIAYCKDDRNCFGVMILAKNELNEGAVYDLKTNVMDYTHKMPDKTLMVHGEDKDYLWETEDVYIIGYYCASIGKYRDDYSKFIESVQVR